MYLKSIEVHGFKSFANKIVLDFHDGITGIVGPNGSGKSNIADAVRWVLGEQSAKQLRGASMQDVIFSGTETRKPMGFAYVAITMDNADHRLPIDYEEVTVARRVYRSGESEYLINNTVCRLRDVQELFMDTGVGKEGYSIIGQGQIDKVLSSKPEDRRELFDEAAGIVKFKKRKAIAEKNLEEEKLNLSRVNDILLEIEHRIGPLEKQSAVAKEYLKLKEELKKIEIDQFFLDYDNNRKTKADQTEKLDIVKADLEDARNSYDGVKDEYDSLTKQLEECEAELDLTRSENSDLEIRAEKLRGEILLLNEQLSGIAQNEENFNERIEAANKSVENKKEEVVSHRNKLNENNERLERLNESQAEINEEIRKLSDAIDARVKSMNGLNEDVFRFINSNSEIQTEIQRLKTLKEQAQISKAEINQQMLNNKNDEASVNKEIAVREEALKEAASATVAKTEEIEITDKNVETLSAQVKAAEEDLASKNQEFSAEESRIESLKNLAERYEGYGSSIRKVMQQKDSVKGIHGVVADLIDVDKKYETAVETALGNNIQNIVTDNEETAKKLIEYLKKNKLGRATFLPISGIDEAAKERTEDLSSEKGVISYAGELVKTDKAYRNVVNYLIGRILVVDNYDNAVKLQKKHKYSLRIVTVEGEYLTPGGSISGGSYKNNSNLLGRKREIEEREEKLAELGKTIKNLTEKKDELRKTRSAERDKSDRLQRELQELYVLQNTAKMNLNQEQNKKNEISDEYNSLAVRLKTVENRISELDNEMHERNLELEENNRQSAENKQKIEDYTKLLEQEQEFRKNLNEQASTIRMEAANYSGAGELISENIERAEAELIRLKEELEKIATSAADYENQKKLREADADSKKAELADCVEKSKECLNKIKKLQTDKEQISKSHSSFFGKSEELMNRISALDKDSFRLQNHLDKVEEQLNASITYLWDEYELSPITAEPLRSADPGNFTQNRKRIGELKGAIRGLGDVNVNAIDEYKETSERYEFLSGQRNDIQAAEEKLVNIINDLDVEMRNQFEQEFKRISEQFDIVFKELFGGGKGTLELTEEDDILEAGIRINAQPPGKKLQNMMQLSGGEKALTAISLLFAIQNLKPSPFCLLDEIEAALDDSNVKRFSKYLNKLTRETQFIIITHRRGTMAAADRLYGITMQEKGVSAQVSVNLIDGELDK